MGNPYPAPLDWSQVTPADRPNLDAALYVVQSTGQYAGTYRSLRERAEHHRHQQPAAGHGPGLLRAGDARAKPPARITFRNSPARDQITPTAQGKPTFQRGTAGTQPARAAPDAERGRPDRRLGDLCRNRRDYSF